MYDMFRVMNECALFLSYLLNILSVPLNILRDLLMIRGFRPHFALHCAMKRARDPQPLTAKEACNLLESFLRAPAAEAFQYPWTRNGCSKTEFPLLDFSKLEGFVLIRRGEKALPYEKTNRVACGCSSQPPRSEGGVQRRMWCCKHLPFTVAFWSIAEQNPAFKMPSSDLLLFERIKQRKPRVDEQQPQQLARVTPQPVLLIQDPRYINFCAVIHDDNLPLLRSLTEYWGLRRVVEVDLHRYGFSLCHEAIRSDRPEIFRYLLSLQLPDNRRPFITRGKRDNGSSVLHQALYHGRLQMTEELCTYGTHHLLMMFF